MPTLEGRRFFFATGEDLRPGLAAAGHRCPTTFVLQETRNDREVTVYESLAEAPEFGKSLPGSVIASPQYFLFRRGQAPVGTGWVRAPFVVSRQGSGLSRSESGLPRSTIWRRYESTRVRCETVCRLIRHP